MGALRDLLDDPGQPTVDDAREATRADLVRLAATDGQVARVEDPVASHAESFAWFARRSGEVHLAFNRYAGRLSDGVVENDRVRFPVGSIWARAFELYHDASTLDEHAIEVYRALGDHVRLGAAPFIGHVFGRAHAVINLESETYDRVGAWRTTNPELITDLRALFVRLWSGSVPLVERAPDTDALVLVRLLAEGREDEEVAADLGLSSFAYRRRLVDLQVALGASSRFAAGVLARRHGLLSLAEAVA